MEKCYFYNHLSPVLHVLERKSSKTCTQETNIFALKKCPNTCHSIDQTKTPIKSEVLINTVLHFSLKLFLESLITHNRSKKPKLRQRTSKNNMIQSQLLKAKNSLSTYPYKITNLSYPLNLQIPCIQIASYIIAKTKLIGQIQATPKEDATVRLERRPFTDESNSSNRNR